MTGKLKGGHNPYTRGCYKNYQYLLCGPSWPRYVLYYTRSVVARFCCCMC